MSATDAPGVERYLYYRVPDAIAAALGPVLRAEQAALCAAHPGLEARLLERVDAAAGERTWMEIYRRPGPGVDGALAAAIEGRMAAHCAAAGVGGRHLESFRTLPPCA